MAGKMSLRVFLTLVEKLPIEKIKTIPPEKLPSQVPMRALDQISSPRKRAEVESLLFSTLTKKLHYDLGDLNEEEQAAVTRALEEAKAWRISVEVRQFNEGLANYSELRQELDKLQKVSFPDEEIQKAAKSKQRELNIQLEKVNQLLDDMYRLRKQRENYIDTLIKNMPKDRSHPEFDEATNRLQEQSRTIERIIAPFLVMRLVDAEHYMADHKNLIKRLESESSVIQQRINVLVDQLDKEAAKNRNVYILKAYQDKKNQLSELYKQKASKQVAISETDLTRWLDYFVEANVNEYASQNLNVLSNKVKRSLFFMLGKYCEAQEDSARSLATGSNLAIDADKAIQFILLSERIILDYFAAKKREYSQGISETAKMRLKAVELLERDLIEELKETKEIDAVVTSQLRAAENQAKNKSFWQKVFSWLPWVKKQQA